MLLLMENLFKPLELLVVDDSPDEELLERLLKLHFVAGFLQIRRIAVLDAKTLEIK